jgi:hypothetical protein
MPRYEYKVVPAPNKGLKGKNVKGAEARFSHALQELMNGLSGYGWEYQRAETLPSIERVGLTGSTTEWRNVLVFRRPREGDADAFNPELLPAPHQFTPELDPIDAKKAEIAKNPKGYEGFFEGENGVEDPDHLSAAPALLSTLASRRKKAVQPDDAEKGADDAVPATDTPPPAPKD